MKSTASIRGSQSKRKSEPAAGPAPKSRKRTKPLTAAEITEIFRRFQKADPEPKGELEHVNPYTLLVAVVLSAQATDAGVNKATRSLFKVANSPAAMIALGEEKLGEYVRTINFNRTKAKNVMALSRRLVDDFAGVVPEDRDALQSLPGVGRKSANVVMNIAFGHPEIAVDTHIFRVANRIGLSKADTPLLVEQDLLKVVPEQFRLHAHHWLILHGRYVCKARKPECWRCLVSDICRYEPKTPPPEGGEKANAGSKPGAA